MTDRARIVVGQLADADRRRVLAAVELGAGHVADIVSRTGLPEPRATKALARLVDSGLVAAAPAGFAVDHSTFTAAARELLARPPSTGHDDRPTNVRRVFAAFGRTADGQYWRIGGSFTLDRELSPPRRSGSAPLPDG